MKPSRSAPAILAAAARDLARSPVAMLGYEVLFRLAWFAAIGPLISWTLRTLVGTTGRYAIGNKELVAFLLSPPGLAAVVLIGMLSLAGLLGQLAGVILIADSASRGRPLSAVGAFRGVLRRLPGLIGLGSRLVARLALPAAPALAVIGLAYLAFWTRFDLYYLTTTRPPAFWAGAVVAGVAAAAYAVVAARLLLRWLVALSVLLVERRSAPDALRISADRAAGRTPRNLGAVVLWAAGVGLLGLAAAGLFRLISEPTLAALPDSLSLAIPALGGLLALQFLLLEAVDIAASVGFALMIYRIGTEDREEVWGSRIAVAGGDDDSDLSECPRSLGRQLVAAVLGLMILAVTFCLGMLSTIGVPPSVTITAHRGGSKAAPENTLAAIRSAIESGADGAEIDVQLAADGVVVVFHDEDLRRVAGDPRRVGDLDSGELRRVDVGSWFGPEFRGERIPTLDEVLDAAGDRLALNIELKRTRGQADPGPLVRAVLDALDRDRSGGRRVVSSLSSGALAEVRRRAPGLPIGFIVFEALGDATRLDVDFLSVRDAIATDGLVSRARRRGMPVHVWTVNDPDRLITLVDRGVADVLTSDPAALVARRDEMARLNDLERLLLWYRRTLVD